MTERSWFAVASSTALDETATRTLEAPTAQTEERRAKPVTASPRAPSSDELRRELGALQARYEALAIAERELRAQLDGLGRMGVRLEAEREHYADLFERAPDAYVVTDRFGIVRDANAAAKVLFGVEIRFLRGKALASFVDPSSVSEVVDAMDQLDRERARRLDVLIRARSGSQVPVRVHVGYGARGAQLNWTFREAAPPACRPASAPPPGSRDLARALEEQEALLARERAAREELERINRVKDRFIAVLSHDLRAPLNAILGWAQLLRREQLSTDERERAFATIERNARTQANLIEELLDVSRISADRIQLTLAPMDAGAATQRAVEAALPKARELGLEVTYDAEPGLTVVADRQRFEQILSNLLSNAMKYTSAPGTIAVTARREGARVEVVVRDTGRGIAPELLPVVFEMYTQERTYTASRHGLGLGLFIVKQLVELQQGTVHAESAGVGKGSTFIVSFPAEDGATVAPSVHAIAVPVQLRHVRVLVVDDEEDSRELMTSILARAGADVASASDVEAALALHASFRPEVVVSDLATPWPSGWDLVSKLRARDPGIAALAVSGFTSPRDTERAIAAGFDLHIGKPFDAAELVEAVYEVTRSRR